MTESHGEPQDLNLDKVTIGIIGGTGAQGTGLAYRLARAGFGVVLGSRDASKAVLAADLIGLGVRGMSNPECASTTDVVIIAVPWDSHQETISSLTDLVTGKIVIDCVNPMGFDSAGAFVLATEAGSAALEAQILLPDSFVVSAFNHVSAVVLSDVNIDEVEMDILITGNNKKATDFSQLLVDRIKGMRGIYAGKLRNSGQVEALTANLISINRRYKIHAGIRITGLDNINPNL